MAVPLVSQEGSWDLNAGVADPSRHALLPFCGARSLRHLRIPS